MAVAFVLVFAFLFFLFWGGVLPLKLCLFVATFIITHSCHVKGESCFFFFMVKPLKTVNCHISMFNHVVMTHVNLCGQCRKKLWCTFISFF